MSSLAVMPLSAGLSGARRAASSSRSLVAKASRAYASSPSGPLKDEVDEVVPPLPRVTFHPRAGSTRQSPPSAGGSSSTPKPPPFQWRPADMPVRTSLEELQKLHPRPDPAVAAAAAAAAPAKAEGAASAAGAAPSGGFASSRSPPSSAGRQSAPAFSASPQPPFRAPRARPRPPKTAPDDSNASGDTPKDTRSFQPVVWTFFALVLAMYCYEKFGDAGYMSDGRKSEQGEIARARREQWLEEVRLERLAKLKGEAPPPPPAPNAAAVRSGAAAPAQPAAVAETQVLPLEVEKVAPAVVQAVSTEQATALAQGQQADAGGTKKRWWRF